MTEFRLTRQEYDFLWEHFELGPKPIVLDIDSHGHTWADRDRLREQAWEALADKGLGRPGDFDPRLRASLRLLARPLWEIDARFTPAGRALAVASATKIVTAMLDDQALALRRSSSTDLPNAAVALLPAYEPGSGKSITLPAAVLDAAAQRAQDDPDVFRGALVASGTLTAGEARRLTEIFADVIRSGHFGAAHTPKMGERKRAGHLISVYDTHAGRYLFTRREDWVTLAAGTDAAVSTQFKELLAVAGS